MQILASKLIGRWVIDRSHVRPVGAITQLLLDPTTLKLAYYQINEPGAKEVLFVRADQSLIEGDVLTIGSESAIGTAEDFLRDGHLFKTPCYLNNYKVYDRNKHYLGHITEYTIRSPGLRVERLHIGVPLWQRLLIPERIISTQLVHEVLPEKKRVIIKHDQATISSKTSASEPVTA